MKGALNAPDKSGCIRLAWADRRDKNGASPSLAQESGGTRNGDKKDDEQPEVNG
jgi:hypothetical protein